jgi:hypothetical protein
MIQTPEQASKTIVHAENGHGTEQKIVMKNGTFRRTKRKLTKKETESIIHPGSKAFNFVF